jgi:hypothetical protein
MALLERGTLEPGASIALLNPPSEKAGEKALKDLRIGDRLPPRIRATVLPRLLTQETET